jgi:hypothetical protein
MEKKLNRGRPSEKPAIVLDKWAINSEDFDGSKYTIKFDKSKTKNGPYSIERTPPKGYHHPKITPDKRKPYGKQPVAVVFKTSNRSNAQTKIKIYKNENIDYINSAKSLVGVPDKAIILELGVGNSVIERYKQKYDLT